MIRGYHGEYKLPANWSHFHNWKNAVASSPSKLLHYIVRQRPRSIRYLQSFGRGHRIIQVTGDVDFLKPEYNNRRFAEFKK